MKRKIYVCSDLNAIQNLNDSSVILCNDSNISLEKLRELDKCGVTVYTPFSDICCIKNLKIVKFNETVDIDGLTVYFPVCDDLVSALPIPNYVDLVVSSEAPISFDPPLERTYGMSYNEWCDILDVRSYLARVLTNIRAKHWVYGKYNQSLSGHFGDLLYRGIKTDELFEM